jgi:2,4-dienoyl-CoA reductase-like NADH-dependent reductase (Old Yellow Enzyme family)
MTMNSPLFSPMTIGNLILKNRLVRSATYEGAADRNGVPGENYLAMYRELARNGVGMIITGFAYIARPGRAMQPLQAGLDEREKIRFFQKVTDEVHQHNCPIVVQLAHAGRQTLASSTGVRPVSSTGKRSVYFREKPRMLDARGAYDIAEQFATSALYAQEAGFDGVQLHAAHGYLIHQFILQDVNRLTHEFGVDATTGIGTKLLDEIIDRTRLKCGAAFPILVKLSGDIDYSDRFYPTQLIHLLQYLNSKQVAAIEISYGTMDYALNIFRGDMQLPLLWKHNPLFKTTSRLKRAFYAAYIRRSIVPKLRPYSAMYNLEYAELAKKHTDIPVISVGGFRSRGEMESVITARKADLIGLSRPFLCEPDFAVKLQEANDYTSPCTHCNRCVFMCEAGRVTRCYTNNRTQP